jgi:ubiquinone/menaquinone biosynthesis C-methylase UbiE
LNEIEVQDNVAGYYVEKRYQGYGLRYHSKIIEEMMRGFYGKILDVGCGTGIIYDLYPEQEIIGIDVSNGMLSHHKGVHLYGSAENIPFDNDTFDCVVCRSVLHHLPDTKKALKEILRVLKPGGKFVCWETNKSWLAELVRKGTQHGDHFSDYHTSFDNLPKLLDKHFRNIKVTYQGFLGYVLYGFPDILRLDYCFRWCFNAVMFLDRFISRVPFLNKLGFAVMIKASK